MESHTQHIYNPYHSHNYALEHCNMYFISLSERTILTNRLQDECYSSFEWLWPNVYRTFSVEIAIGLSTNELL